MDDCDHSKVFVGGISWETTEDILRDHFSNYGIVVGSVIAKDRATNRPRGFAFVSFSDTSTLDRVLADAHTILGRTAIALFNLESLVVSLVPCKKHGGVRFTINGRDYFELVLIHNIADAGSIQSVQVKGSKTGWVAMSRNWGANWQSNSYLNGQSLSFMVTTTDGVTKTFTDIVPANWGFGQTFSSPLQF